MKNKLYISLALIGGVMLASCGGDSSSTEEPQSSSAAVTTDLINNPNTASEEKVDPATMPKIEFENDVYEFGQITQGEKVQHSFVFTNTGKSSLIISSASGSCGCTVPSWPKEPIAPGEQGQIDVVFDSNGKQGQQTKTVTLVANTDPNKITLALKGEILVSEEL